MALRIVTVVVSLVLLSAIHIRGEGNQDKDAQVQSSHFHQVSHADIQTDNSQSRILRSAGSKKKDRRENAVKGKKKRRQSSKRGNKKRRKVVKTKKKKFNKNISQMKVKKNKHKKGKKKPRKKSTRKGNKRRRKNAKKGNSNKSTKKGDKNKSKKSKSIKKDKRKNNKKKVKKNKRNKGKKGKKNSIKKRGKNKKNNGKIKNRKRKKDLKLKCKKGKRNCNQINKKRNRKNKKDNQIKCKNKNKNGKCIKKKKTGKRKGKMAGRKTKKSKKKSGRDDNNNKNNQKKKQKKISKKKIRKGKFRAVVCEDCVVKLSNYAKLYVAQAKNRKQQILRLEAACKTSKKKEIKKEEFDKTYKMLLDNAGGNGSDPKCKGKSVGKAVVSSSSSSVSIISSSNSSVSIISSSNSSISIISSSNSSTSRQDTPTDGEVLVDDMSTLLACNKSIRDGCNSCLLNDPAQKKKAEDCKKAMVSFISKMDNCLNVTKYANQEALCTCVDGIDDANKTLENQIRKCKWVTAASSKEVNNKKKCIGVFSACRKAEDASVGHLHKCKLPLIKCGGVTTVDEAKKDLPILKNLKKELDATEAKMKNGFTNNGLDALNTTKDSKTPSGLSDFIKNPSGSSRAASKCRQLAQAFLKFNESAKGTGESANSDMNGTEASNTTDILKQMKTRDFDSEVADCKKTTKQQTVLLIIIRFYGATMILWRTTIIDVKIVVLGLVISNAAKEDTSTTTVDPSATTAAATTAAATTAGASTAGASTAGASTAGATTAGASTAGASTAGASTAGATTVGASTAGASTAGATTAGATTAGTSTAAVSTARAQGRKKKFLDRMLWLQQKVLKA